ncbi:hypothetical protein BSL78_22925, partial [Apostichopus japonicus]
MYYLLWECDTFSAKVKWIMPDLVKELSPEQLQHLGVNYMGKQAYFKVHKFGTVSSIIKFCFCRYEFTQAAPSPLMSTPLVGHMLLKDWIRTLTV